MNTIQITAIYAALLGFMFVAITLRVAMIRNARQLSLGDGGDKHLAKLIRGHGNFAETTPIALILLVLLELQGTSAMTLHTLGLALLAGRVSHYLQMTGTLKPIAFRAGGMILTLGTIVAAAARLIAGAF